MSCLERGRVLVLGELGEFQGESQVDEFEGVHGAVLVQIVGVEDGFGLFLGGAVDVEEIEGREELFEGEVALLLLVQEGEEVEGEADEQDGGKQLGKVKVARVGLIGQGGQALDSPWSQASVAQILQNILDLCRRYFTS